MQHPPVNKNCSGTLQTAEVLNTAFSPPSLEKLQKQDSSHSYSPLRHLPKLCPKWDLLLQV